MAYLVRKLLHSILLFLAVSLLGFVLLAVAPGDFFSDLRLNPAMGATSMQHLRIQQELNLSLPVRYWHWMRGIFRGDWGVSMAYQVPIWPLLRARAVNTLLLTVTATSIAWFLALWLGIWVSMRRAGGVDRAVTFGTSLILGIPDIMIGLLLLVWAVRTRSLPAGGMQSLAHASLPRSEQIVDTLRHLALPVTALVISAFPVLVRHVRSSMVEALEAAPIQTARAAGVSRLRIALRHALPLASNPLISLLGLSIAGLLSGSLLVEWIMSWPGLGPLLLEAIFARDTYVVLGTMMLSTLLLLTGNLFADFLLFVADPRTRDQRL